MYESLTAFIPALEAGFSGEWAEQKGDGSAEKPFTFPFVNYSGPVYTSMILSGQ